MRVALTATPPATPYFGLYRCDVVCTEVARLTGGIGTTAAEVLVSVPLSLFGAPQDGSTLTTMKAFTAFGEATPGASEPLDQIDLSNTTVPVPRVSFGIAAAGTSEADIAFDTPATLTAGTFSGTLPALAPGEGVWVRACLGAVCGPAVSWPSTAPLVNVVSSKVHGSAGTFNIDLPLSGNPGIECRSGGTSGDHTLVFSFANTLTSVAGASVTSGTGSVSSHAIGSDAHQYVVDLTGVTNLQVITVSLTGVQDMTGPIGDISQSMGVVVGDTTDSRSVNSSDISQTKSQSGQKITASNFRQDVTVNGSINSSDIALVKSRSGTALP